MHPTKEREFAEYFADRQDAVRRIAYLLCGDWHRADDVAQTAFVQLHRQVAARFDVYFATVLRAQAAQPAQPAQPALSRASVHSGC